MSNFSHPHRRNSDRWLSWLLAIILAVCFAQIPVYIYVLEQHSAAIAKVESQLAVNAQLLARLIADHQHLLTITRRTTP